MYLLGMNSDILPRARDADGTHHRNNQYYQSNQTSYE